MIAIRSATPSAAECNTTRLFITGGMSMGEYDYVPALLAELGVELKITKLRIKPGKPFVFGVSPASRAAADSSSACRGIR